MREAQHTKKTSASEESIVDVDDEVQNITPRNINQMQFVDNFGDDSSEQSVVILEINASSSTSLYRSDLNDLLIPSPGSVASTHILLFKTVKSDQ